MKDLFADTYYSNSLLGPKGPDRDKAVAASIGRSGRLVTTAWVLTELANFLHRVGNRTAYVRFYNKIKTHPETVILEPTQIHFERGMWLYESRPDKEW
ncbi:MAG TPA: hypothetical protein VG326_17225 [Tepidisphaeraceae bacterium]|jgi:hypothetical protein|nr:hypothetical protein [Tepidisphaeraceae bacterium]